MTVTRYKEFYSKLSTLEKVIFASIALAIIVALYFAAGGVSDWFKTREALAKAAAAQKQADEERSRADAAQKNADVQKGIADAKSQEAEKAKAEAEAARQQAQQSRDDYAAALNTASASRETFNRTRRTVTHRAGTLDERAKRLGSDLDEALSSNP